MRWSGVGTFLPPRARSTASARVAFQRQREPNIGASSIACTSRCSAVSGFRYWNTSSSGKLCWGPSDRTIASSVAAACSSKLKLRQNRLRSARPHARLTRLPKGACSTSCIPPASSKKRSSTSVSCVGITPRIFCDASRYSTIWRAAGSGTPGISPASHAVASRASASRPPTSRRSRDTSCDNSGVRPGAAEPEGNRWWLALGVDDAHLARLDFLDQIGPVAQLEDVARHTLDCEILVEGSDEGLRRLEDHPVVADVRNRPARRERGEPGAAARA